MPVSSRDRQTAARSCSARTSVTTDPTGRAAVNNPEARWVLSEIPAACTVINDRKLVRNRRSSVANEQASGAMILQHHVADAAQDLGPRRRSRHALHRAAVRSGQRHAAGGAYRHHSETFASPGSSPSGRHRGAGPAPVRRHRAKPSGPNRPKTGGETMMTGGIRAIRRCIAGNHIALQHVAAGVDSRFPERRAGSGRTPAEITALTFASPTAARSGRGRFQGRVACVGARDCPSARPPASGERGPPADGPRPRVRYDSPEHNGYAASADHRVRMRRRQ